METSMRDWLGKQYDPILLDKEQLETATGAIFDSPAWINGSYDDKQRIMKNTWKQFAWSYIAKNKTAARRPVSRPVF